MKTYLNGASFYQHHKLKPVIIYLPEFIRGRLKELAKRKDLSLQRFLKQNLTDIALKDLREILAELPENV